MSIIIVRRQKTKGKANNYCKLQRKTQKHLDKRAEIGYNIIREFCKRPLARVQYGDVLKRPKRRPC